MTMLRFLPITALAACASAASARRDAPAGVLSFPITQSDSPLPLSRRQAADTDVPILNYTSVSYLIQLDIGTPAQSLKVAIDTGSSELWVNPNCDNAGVASQERTCNANGHYDWRASSTSDVTNLQGHVKYGKGEVIIRYVSDNIALPGSVIDLSNVTFGSAMDSVDLTMGIMGLSFGEGTNMDYPSFVDELQRQGVTQTRAFGVGLGQKDEPANSGVISFGGVDTKKFSGKLHTSAILGPQNGERLLRYWVQLDSVGLTKSGSSAKTYSASSYPVFFDTGATLSYLPTRTVRALASDLGAFLDPRLGDNIYNVPCGQSGTIDFKFGDFTLNVPMQEFIWQVDRNICVLGAVATDDGSNILGDSFLRAAYVVFDIDTPALHFARYSNCGTNLQAIPRGKNAAASLTGECQAGSSGGAGGSGGSGGSSGNPPNAAGRMSPASSLLAAVGALAFAMSLL